MLLVHAKPTSVWWWAELHGVIGYVPASLLRQEPNEEEEALEDPWQDEEYFGSYGTLVRNLKRIITVCINSVFNAQVAHAGSLEHHTKRVVVWMSKQSNI